MKNFKIDFNTNWILSKREESILPVEAVSKMLKSEFSGEIIYCDLTSCEVVIDNIKFNDEQCKARILDLLKKQYDLPTEENVFSITVSDYVLPEKNEEIVEENKETVEENTEEEKECEQSKNKIAEENVNNSSKKSAVEVCDELIGAEEFKELIKECSIIAPGICEHNVRDAFTARSYLFSINSGYGFTTYAELFADVVEELDLFKTASKNRVVELTLSSDPHRENESFEKVLSNFQRFNCGKIVCIDISEWMLKINEAKFRDFLFEINKNIGKNIVFFRVPYIEKHLLMEINQNLNDILTVKAVSIVPFNEMQLREYAEKLFVEKKFTVDEEAWTVFNEKIAEEKNDGRFYGVKTVKKVVLEIIYQKQLYNALNNSDDIQIESKDIKATLRETEITQKSGFQALDDLVGMEEVKERIKEVVSQIEASLKNDSLDKPCIHMRFLGNPGTGKTTVARILGKILRERGVLRNGNFFEYTGRDLCGRYVGETAPKTAAICRDAYGSVLFIDEAYSLYRGDSHGDWDYGKEAIDTLVAEMENNRSDFMVIMSGYTDDMNKMLTGNAGLKSRMPYEIVFPNYTREQLAQIFFKMAGKYFSVDNEAKEMILDYFNKLPDQLLESKEFSNARFARNLFERTWGKAVLRSQLANQELKEITAEDFRQASADKEFIISVDRRKSIGFSI